jgi:hypothetical protein
VLNVLQEEYRSQNSRFQCYDHLLTEFALNAHNKEKWNKSRTMKNKWRNDTSRKVYEKEIKGNFKICEHYVLCRFSIALRCLLKDLLSDARCTIDSIIGLQSYSYRS